MDTDDLSDAAYKGIFIEAEKFNHNLTLQFGLIAASCKNEKEYLKRALERIEEIKTLDEENYSFIFFDEIPAKVSLFQVLRNITENISMLEK
jgi:hypothetical protein